MVKWYNFRDWVFTLNNPDPKTMKPILDSEKVRYLAYQLEMSTTGTKHLQGYVEFFESENFKDVLKLFNGRDFHIEKRRGSREQARDYCIKEESRIRGPWIVGEWHEEEPEKKCQALTVKNEQCKNFALPNRDFCGVHL